MGENLQGRLITSVTFLQATQPRAQKAHRAGDIKGVVSLCNLSTTDVEIYIRGTSFKAVTDSNGQYYLSYVQAGTYDLTVKYNGAVIGTIPQVNVKKKRITNVATTDICDTTPVTDNDNDGFSPPLDCNDNDAAINPGASEVCGDGIDNNCNNQVDEACNVCTDLDNDGFFAQFSCGTPVDCDDSSASIFPGAPEICDGLDNNCNNLIDVDEGLANCAL